MNLSRKLPLAIALALLFTLAAGFFGLWTAYGSLSVFHTDVEGHVNAERRVADIESHFKTQVQEWKNVLLRGADAGLRDKHWAAFQADEKSVQDKASALMVELQEADLVALADRFLAEHRKMAAGYRDGLQKFQASQFNPTAGDVAVRGVDREPAKLLTELKAAIATQSRTVSDQAYLSGTQATKLSLVLMVLAAVLGVAIGVFITRAVLQPLHSALQVAQEVAQGNLASPIHVPGKDELSRL